MAYVSAEPHPAAEAGPDFPNFSLRLFMGVDIVGSTAFKQSSPQTRQDQAGQHWFQAFSEFFTAVETKIHANWAGMRSKLPPELAQKVGDHPRFWKAAGDEAIFQLEITDLLQVPFALYCFIEAVNGHRQEIKTHRRSLDLKSTAWIAGFPVNNAEIALGVASERLREEGIQVEEQDYFSLHLFRLYLHKQEERPGEHLDFIGPQMDLGFRLAAKSTARHMVLSADLCLLLVEAMERHGHELPGTFGQKFTNGFAFLGTEVLKGVLGSFPYPLFALSTQPDKKVFQAEEEMLRATPPTPQKVKEYVKAFTAEVRDETDARWVVEPFISESFGSALKDHEDGLQRQRKRFRETLAARKDVEQSGMDASHDRVEEIKEVVWGKLRRIGPQDADGNGEGST